LDGLYLNCIRLVRDYFEKFLKIDLKPNRIIGIGLKSVLQLLADKDLRGAETLLEHMVIKSFIIFALRMLIFYLQNNYVEIRFEPKNLSNLLLHAI